MDAIEKISYKKLGMFIKSCLLNIDAKDFEGKIGTEMISIKRPLYGLLYVKKITRSVVKMVQVAPTGVSRFYLMSEPWPGSRIYVEEHKNGISVFMLSEAGDTHAQRFIDLTDP